MKEPRRYADVLGCKVRLLRPRQTHGGAFHDVGTMFRVVRSHTGVLLERETICPRCRSRFRHQLMLKPRKTAWSLLELVQEDPPLMPGAYQTRVQLEGRIKELLMALWLGPQQEQVVELAYACIGLPADSVKDTLFWWYRQQLTWTVDEECNDGP